MRKVAALLLSLYLLPAFGGDYPDAQPPLVRFSPTIDVYPQNFAITADRLNHVYVGNADGILIFDGESWQLTELPNKEIVRSLDYDRENDRVYVGGFDSLGYIERNIYGAYDFQDLTELYEKELGGEPFADIWETVVTSHGVFFVALSHLFLLDPNTGETRFWQTDSSYGPIVEFNGRVFVQWNEEGLKAFDGERWELVSDDVADTWLTGLVDAGEALVVVNGEGDWIRYDGKNFETIEGTAEVPFNSSSAFAFLSEGNRIGLTTQLGHLVFFDLDSGETEVLKVSNGFIPSIAFSDDGYLLVVDDLGFVALRWPARMRVIDASANLAGSTSRIAIYDDDMYVLSSSGVFRASREDRVFHRLDWTDHEAWDLIQVGDELLLADSYYIKIISGDEVSILEDETTARVFIPSRFHQDRMLVGTEYGIQILERSDDGWRVTQTVDEMTNLTTTHIVEISANELLLGSDRGGIHKLKFDEAGDVQITRFDESDGIEYGNITMGAFVYQLADELIASTSEGFFRYQDGRFAPYDLMSIEQLRTPGQTLELYAENDELWAYHYNRLFRFEEKWIEEDVAGTVDGGITYIARLNNLLMVGAMGTFMQLDVNIPELNGYKATATITQATVSADTANTQTQNLRLSDIELSTANERLTLKFAMVDFTRPEKVQFRTRLAPVESQFSHWSSVGQQSFVDLAPDAYTFVIESKNSHGGISSLRVPITVNPQWFETVMFQVALIVSVLAITFFSLRYFAGHQARVLAHERDLLEQKVSERTRELQSANRQLDRMAHLDGLTQIPNRRKLDTYLEDVKKQCVERNRPLAVALLDVDHFKNYNDEFGHPAGDILLVELAKLLSRNLRRAEDLVARYGGEEFLVVLPGADLAAASEVVEKMRAQVAASDLGVTISGGLHVDAFNVSTVDEMVAQADEALYRAKNGGRNMVVFS